MYHVLLKFYVHSSFLRVLHKRGLEYTESDLWLANFAPGVNIESFAPPPLPNSTQCYLYIGHLN